TDEFIQPTVLPRPGESGEAPDDRLRAGEPFLLFNFRPDRMRQLTRALSEPKFEEFDRGSAPIAATTTMTSYQEEGAYPGAVPPAALAPRPGGSGEAPAARLRAGEPFLLFNFRPDRMRQLTRALSEPKFEEFDRGSAPIAATTTMTSYQEEWAYPVAFPPAKP